jgi:hypothetical protein
MAQSNATARIEASWEADVLPLNYIGLTSRAGDHEGSTSTR